MICDQMVLAYSMMGSSVFIGDECLLAFAPVFMCGVL